MSPSISGRTADPLRAHRSEHPRRLMQKTTGLGVGPGFQWRAGQMQLAKNVIDLGLSTNNLEPMLRFWQQDAGLRFDHVLPVRRGQKQYRHDALGSVIKFNHHVEPLPAAAPSGYRELIIAREGVEKPRSMVDPDGNRVRLVPPAHDGITQLAIRMGVRSLSEHRRFYGHIFGFAEQPWSGGSGVSPG